MFYAVPAARVVFTAKTSLDFFNLWVIESMFVCLFVCLFVGLV